MGFAPTRRASHRFGSVQDVRAERWADSGLFSCSRKRRHCRRTSRCYHEAQRCGLTLRHSDLASPSKPLPSPRHPVRWLADPEKSKKAKNGDIARDVLQVGGYPRQLFLAPVLKHELGKIKTTHRRSRGGFHSGVDGKDELACRLTIFPPRSPRPGDAHAEKEITEQRAPAQ